LFDQALQDISDNNEEVWRDRISLSKASTARNPSTWDTIEHDSCFPGEQNLPNPTAPPIIKTTSHKDSIQATPFDRVESFF